MSESPVSVMDEQECWELLRSTPIGRIAMSVGGEVEVFPVNYEMKNDAIFVRTAEGTKLFAISMGKPVTMEIDDWDEVAGWSVIAKCTATVLDPHAEEDAANDLTLQPWVPTRKNVYVKLTPARVSGRRFTFGPETDEDSWK